MSYDHKSIESRWQKFWSENQTFKSEDISTNKPKYYVLDMFPYPSGAGLHVGHALGYVATDIVARYKRMKGFNVLHPMGWDAFGLPAEQYALKTGTHPKETTHQNVSNFKRQINSLGFSYDWSKEINTTDPNYYKWTQWIFMQLYNKGLAYEQEVAVNWCPELKAVLANEEVVNGKSDIGGHPVVRLPMRQWILKITDYAESLLDGLDDLDWPENIKELQKNWIGKSEGVELGFDIDGHNDIINVYEQIIDSMASDYKKSFLLHYNFPPYCVGETGRIGFTNRREIGHGHLAERSLKPILPSSEEFPYTIRIVSEITESNGSSSMASVCGGSLAMMNAGVPIKEHVAGIAMGLIMEDDDNYAVLSDILGTEDFLGDMDFKVAGTKDGISAIQLDLKVPGLSMDVLSNALEQANKGRLHILGEMNKAIDKPNALSQYAPQIESFKIDKDKIGALIGPGGKNIKALQENAECVINIEDDGTVSVSAENKAKLDNAISQIKAVVQDPEVGTVFDGKVTKILDFGAFVEFAPGREGLVHISQLAWERVNKVEDVLSEGDQVKIKLFEIDKQGRLNFSIKLLTEKPE